MRTDPAGRAGVSQRGSNNEMRAGERRRGELGRTREWVIERRARGRGEEGEEKKARRQE